MDLKMNLNEPALPKHCLHPGKENPFEVLVFEDFIEKQDQVEALKNAVIDCIELDKKDNDLYKFQQSKDLNTIKKKKSNSIIRNFVKLLQTDVLEVIERTTGVKLTSEHIDVTVSKYEKGNYLLCHNDDIKNPSEGHKRAIAFIYYLVNRPWYEEDGGALILYESDKNDQPVAISNKLYPQPNTFVIFETTQKSWHSVEEIFANNDIRYSINGWFHCLSDKLDKEANHSIEPCPYSFIKPTALEERVQLFFQECINPDYLMSKVCHQIKSTFEEDSEVNLTNFLVKQKYDQICADLREASRATINLVHKGPYNKRNYSIIDIESCSEICKTMYDAFKSELFFMMLSNMTGLDLEPSTLKTSNEQTDEHFEEQQALSSKKTKKSSDGSSKSKRKKQSDPLSRMELRNFDFGSYTLVHDYAYELHEKSALDVILHFNHDFDVSFDNGGFIHYLAINNENLHDVDDELLTIEPQSNSLSLVYRTDGTCRFVKYLTHRHKNSYQDLCCVFYESKDSLPKS